MDTVDDLRYRIAAEKERYESAELRWLTQYSSLSQNNANLARINNRLKAELERLKSETDKTKHALTGKVAVYKAKESETAARVEALVKEVCQLEERLCGVEAENDGLRAQLFAKQEVTNYLEWRLSQMKTFTTTYSEQRTPAMAHASAFHHSDTFDVYEDSSSVDAPVNEVVVSTISDKENNKLDADVDPNASIRYLVADEEEQGDSATGVLTAAANDCFEEEAAVELNDTVNSEFQTPIPRRSSHRRRERLSYALPSINAKLRQGDPFTFGDPSALKTNKTRARRTNN